MEEIKIENIKFENSDFEENSYTIGFFCLTIEENSVYIFVEGSYFTLEQFVDAKPDGSNVLLSNGEYIISAPLDDYNIMLDLVKSLKLLQ